MTCANYTAEIWGWIAFTVAVQTVAPGLFILGGGMQMAIWGTAKHARLRKVRCLSQACRLLLHQYFRGFKGRADSRLVVGVQVAIWGTAKHACLREVRCLSHVLRQLLGQLGWAAVPDPQPGPDFVSSMKPSAVSSCVLLLELPCQALPLR